jgi:hypothetical protein
MKRERLEKVRMTGDEAKKHIAEAVGAPDPEKAKVDFVINPVGLSKDGQMFVQHVIVQWELVEEDPPEVPLPKPKIRLEERTRGLRSDLPPNVARGVTAHEAAGGTYEATELRDHLLKYRWSNEEIAAAYKDVHAARDEEGGFSPVLKNIWKQAEQGERPYRESEK